MNQQIPAGQMPNAAIRTWHKIRALTWPAKTKQHPMLVRCWPTICTAGPPSRRWPHAGRMLSYGCTSEWRPGTTVETEKTVSSSHWPNSGWMLARRLRRRPNIHPALVQFIVYWVTAFLALDDCVYTRRPVRPEMSPIIYIDISRHPHSLWPGYQKKNTDSTPAIRDIRVLRHGATLVQLTWHRTNTVVINCVRGG